MRVTWGDPNQRYYEHGLDRGVLYIPGKDPIPWNGLVNFDEGASGSTSLLYRDGVIYLADADASDFSGVLKTMWWPDDFGECLGIPQATDGLFVDNQKPKPFGFSYRSLVGSGSRNDRFGYQIHLVYGCMASIGSRGRQTIGKDTTPVEFSFDIVCTPVKLPGFRPTAHYIIDTRNMSPTKLAEIEDIIYGTSSTAGELPDPVILYDLMNFGDAMTFTVHTDGTYTVEGSNDNLFALSETSFMMKNINAVDNLDGTYTVSDGGTTDVIIE